jgi:hypothetical protein
MAVKATPKRRGASVFRRSRTIMEEGRFGGIVATLVPIVMTLIDPRHNIGALGHGRD